MAILRDDDDSLDREVAVVCDASGDLEDFVVLYKVCDDIALGDIDLRAGDTRIPWVQLQVGNQKALVLPEIVGNHRISSFCFGHLTRGNSQLRLARTVYTQPG